MMATTGRSTLEEHAAFLHPASTHDLGSVTYTRVPLCTVTLAAFAVTAGVACLLWATSRRQAQALCSARPGGGRNRADLRAGHDNVCSETNRTLQD